MLIGLGIVAIIVLQLYIRWNQRSSLKEREQEVATLANDPGIALETIFVTLPCYDVHACTHTLVSIFDKASCPGRVFVGVLHVIDKNRQESMLDLTSELQKYVEDSAKTGWPLIQEHVRIATLANTECAGDGWVRAYMENMLYRGEKYYLSLQGQTTMVDKWDSSAIEQLKECPSEYPILVCCNGSNEKANFLVATDAQPMVIHMSQRPLQSKPLKPVPSLFCSSSFFFCTGDRLVDVPSPDSYYYATMSELATDLSIRLWTSGWDFYCPKEHICSSTIGMQPCPPSSYNTDLLYQIRPGSFRSLVAYQAFCGVDCVQGQVSGRAKLGVTDGAAASEIVAKYGSVTSFNYQKALV